MTRTFGHGSKARLTARDLDRFPSASLFDRVGRAAAAAGCLPRKELYEAWEVARRVRRWYRGGRVVDLGAGHGLLAHLMLLLDDSSPAAVAVDRRRPPCAAGLEAALVSAWPRLAHRVSWIAGGVEAVTLGPGDLVVSCHACGSFADEVLDAAIAARARVAVLPCCHDRATCDTGGLAGWMDAGLAVDATRALRLREAGYDVRTQTIPATITPKNRLLLGAPR